MANGPNIFQMLLVIHAYDCGQIEKDSGLWSSGEYSTFAMADETARYRLTAAGYSGDAGDPTVELPQWWSFVANPFSTFDNDADHCGACNCAAAGGSGWWFGWCTGADLNYDDNAIWGYDDSGGLTADVLAARMLLKVD